MLSEDAKADSKVEKKILDVRFDPTAEERRMIQFSSVSKNHNMRAIPRAQLNFSKFLSILWYNIRITNFT